LFLYNLIVKTIQKYFARPYHLKGSKWILSRMQKFNYLKNPVKTGRYDRIINELCHFYKVSLIKTGFMFHKYHLLNQWQVFMRYKKLPKWTLISLYVFCVVFVLFVFVLCFVHTRFLCLWPVHSWLSFRFSLTFFGRNTLMLLIYSVY
jgi:hypothetical protein